MWKFHKGFPSTTPLYYSFYNIMQGYLMLFENKFLAFIRPGCEMSNVIFMPILGPHQMLINVPIFTKSDINFRANFFQSASNVLPERLSCFILFAHLCPQRPGRTLISEYAQHFQPSNENRYKHMRPALTVVNETHAS